MSLATNISNLATRIATEIKSVRTLVNGNAVDLSALSTTAKTNLVAAINEVAGAVGSAGASINDGTISTLSVWSSSKTNTEIAGAIAALVASAPGALDTLDELAAALGDDANFAASVTSSLALKAPLASPTFTGTVSGITKAMVGLSNVDNTTDAAKPVSTAQQTALNLKAPLASPTFTGTVSGITKAMVGLGNVDNTSDAAKPVSTAQQAALDLKASLIQTGDPETNYVTVFNAGLV